jgi:hypothetical protein
MTMLRARGPYLSFLKASFSVEFLEEIIKGDLPKMETIVEVFPKRHSSGPHVGYNLLVKEERQKAFEARYKLREFVLHLT